MATRVEINVEVREDGSVQIKPSGIKGNACYAKMDDIYKALRAEGVDVSIEASTPTDELNQKETNKNVAKATN